MGITVGFIGGGGAGGNLWRFQTAPPVTDIMLNDLAGVTGIAAPLPAAPDLNFIFKEVAPGVFFGGFVNYISGTQFVANVTNKGGGGDEASIAAIDLATGAEAARKSYFDGAQPITGSFVSDGVDVITEESLEPGYYILRTENETTGDKTETQQTIDTREVNIYKAGIEVFRLRIDENGLAVYNNAGANLLFQVSDTGEILTNQTQAATAIDTTIVGRFPVHDETGTLIGYAPLMIDP